MLGLISEILRFVNGRHRIKVVRDPSSDNSGNKFKGKAYWRSGNQTLANQLPLTPELISISADLKMKNKTQLKN